MNSVSESQYKVQPDQQNSSYDLSAAPMKRKRGRPRKDEVSGSEPNRRLQQCRLLRSPSSNHGLVGQEVSGSFVGVFDAGYLLTVQVGSSGPTLRGMVFDPRLAVPVSTENDVAPHLPMLRRNEFSYPVAEGLINQGAVSSQAYMAPKDISIQYIQAKEPPTTSSFTSPVPSALQLNLMEVTPSHSSHVPQPATETKEPQLVSKISNIILEGAAAKTSDQNPVSSTQFLQSEVKNEHTLISVEFSDVSEAPANAYKPPNDTNCSNASVVTSSQVSKPYHVSNPLDTSTAVPLDVSKPSVICRDAPAEATFFNVSNPSDVFKEAMTHVSDEPLNIPTKLLPISTDACLDVSNVVPMDISKHLDVSREAASGITKYFTLDEQEPLVASQNAAFGPIQFLECQTVKAGGMAEENLSPWSLEKSSERLGRGSEDPKVNEVLMAYNNYSEIPKGDKSEGVGGIIGCMTQLSQPNIAVAGKLEDASRAPQASTYQP